jgi:hypothetical protein
MTPQTNTEAHYVIKADELPALNYLRPDHPLPLFIEWINRGTNRKMRRTTIDLLLRTMGEEGVSPSVTQLRETSGLRVIFASDADRSQFAAAFVAARAQLASKHDYLVGSIFDSLEQAEQAVEALKNGGIPQVSISLLRQAGEFGFSETDDSKGHSKLNVAVATAGGGLAGALLGIGMLAMIPGVGLVAAAGAIAATAFPTVASLSAVIGATGGAIARMLTDHDVDGREADYYERQIRRGRVFICVDTRLAKGQRDVARRILMRSGGHFPKAA